MSGVGRKLSDQSGVQACEKPLEREWSKQWVWSGEDVTLGLRGSAVEHQSLASVLSPSCARPVTDG